MSPREQTPAVPPSDPHYPGHRVSATSLPSADEDHVGDPESLTVGDRSLRGATWTILAAVVGKVLSLFCQIALAWFLLPREFGFAAMALAVASFAKLMTASGLQVVLVQRQDQFDEDVGQVFWLALTLHVIIAIFLMAISPLAGVLFRAPQVTPLIVVIAVAFVLFSLSTIYLASLKAHLRFGSLARINFFRGVVRLGFMLVLAMLGFGAYSLVLPLIFAAIFTAVASRLTVGPIPIGKPNPRMWMRWIAPAFWVSIYVLLASMTVSGTTVAVGLLHGATVTGLYSWGFNLSVQTIFLLSANLQLVFFSALAKLSGQPERQHRAIKVACQFMIILVAPLCVLQALMARPMIELMFHTRWLPAIPVVQWLSLSMMTRPLTVLAVSLLMARGLYRRLVLLTGFTSLTVVAASCVGAYVGEQAEIAWCVGVSLFLTQLVAGWVAFRLSGHGWVDLIRTIGPPLGLLAVVMLLGSCLCAWTTMCQGAWGSLAVGGVGILLYALLIRICLPQASADILLRVKRASSRRRNRGKAVPKSRKDHVASDDM